MKAIARGWRGLPWAQALLVALAVGQAGCSCFVSEFEPPLQGLDEGCLLGTPCPDGSCVLNAGPSWGGVCCGFGGECDPCPGPFGGVECPDGTCALWAEACCEQGGSCDPGDDDDPHRLPGSTEGDTDASGPEEGSSTEGSSTEGSSTEGSSTEESSTEESSSDTDDVSTTTGDDMAASSGSTE